MLADHRCVLILDDAADAEQVSALVSQRLAMPVLVTSRVSLPGLAPDELVLRPLRAADSVELLCRLGGLAGLDDEERTAAEAIAVRLGNLPLALELVGGRIAGAPGWSVADHRDALGVQAEHLRLPEQISAGLDLSLERLGAAARRTLSLLADQPCTTLSADAVAAVGGLPVAGSTAVLVELERSHLVTVVDGRWGMHSITRVAAGAAGIDQDPPSLRESARARLLDHLEATTRAAVHAAGSAPFGLGAGEHEPWPGSPDDAVSWLATERANLITLADPVHAGRRPDVTRRLSLLLSRYLESHGLHADAVILHSRAVAWARRANQPAAEARASVFLAQSLARLGEPDEAVALAQRALDLVEAEPDARVSAMNVLAVVELQQGRPRAALGLLRQALDVVEAGGTTRSPASLVGNIAAVLFGLGDFEEAAEQHRRSFQIAREEGDHSAAGLALSNLSEVHLTRADHHSAAETAEQACELAERFGLLGVLGVARSNLGNALAALGRHDEARVAHRAGLDVAGRTGERNDEAAIYNNLADCEAAAGDERAARTAYEAAGRIARDVGNQHEVDRHLDGLARLG